MRQGQAGINAAKVLHNFHIHKFFDKKNAKKMKFIDFERVLSQERMARYLNACNGDSKKAMTLYRYNLRLSQEMFTIISCFEVALRNAIDQNLSQHMGQDWLRDSIMPNGIFHNNPKCVETAKIIQKSYNKLTQTNAYTHSQLITEMKFGVWKYMFSQKQFQVTGQTLLRVFPNKTKSTPQLQINHTYIYNELDNINKLRNRIAHHEPICFGINGQVIDTSYIQSKYWQLQTLFQWMNIDSRALLYGIDHVQQLCDKIRQL